MISNTQDSVLKKKSDKNEVSKKSVPTDGRYKILENIGTRLNV